MLKLTIRDVEVESEERGFVYCEDELGDIYEFPVPYNKARMIALLSVGAYIPQGSVYEFIVELLDQTSLRISSVVITDAYGSRALIRVKDFSTGKVKAFYMSIPDAIILALLSGAEMYIKREAEILLADDMDRFFWYRFLKELDLC